METVRSFYERYIYEGLALSILIHLLLIGAYYAVSSMPDEERVLLVPNRPPIDIRLLPPPPLDGVNVRITVAPLLAKIDYGIPVPVPDAQVNPEMQFATIEDLKNKDIGAIKMIGDGRDVGFRAPQEVIEIEDPDPEIFVPTEKLPVPVKQVAPEYPPIALKTGIEGTVWVKILVDRDGRAKKAIIAKSDSELFDEAALKAALQWVFAPAMMNSGPVKVWTSVPFRFRLKQ